MLIFLGVICILIAVILTCKKGMFYRRITPSQDRGMRLNLLLTKIESCLRWKYHQRFPKEPTQLYLYFQNNHLQDIHRLLNKKIINQKQYDLLLPPNQLSDSSKFDTTLLVLQLRSLWFKNPPRGGSWDKLPNPKDNTDVAHIVRLKLARNEIQHSLEITEVTYNGIFKNILNSMQAFGCPKKEIDDIRTCNLQNFKLSLHSVILIVIMVVSAIFLALYLAERPQGKSYNLQSPTALFYGRNEQLLELHSKLNTMNETVGVVIHGLTGVGKSQLAKRYCQIYGDHYDNNIAWIYAHTPTNIEENFKDFAEILGFNITNKRAVSLKENSYDYFRKSKLLIVFDDIKNTSDIVHYLPTPSKRNIHVLVTSQIKTWESRFAVVKLRVFSKETALNFLNLEFQKITENPNLDPKNIEFIAEELQYHPLAMQQAIAYIRTNHMLIEHYVESLKKSKFKLLSQSCDEVEIGCLPVTKTISMSLEQLKKSNLSETTLSLLYDMSILDSANIQKGLFSQVYNLSVIRINEALNQIAKYSLISFSQTSLTTFHDHYLSMHSLVQKVIITELLNNKKSDNVLQKFWKRLLRPSMKIKDFDLYSKYVYKHLIHIANNEMIMRALSKLGRISLEGVKNVLLFEGDDTLMDNFFERLLLYSIGDEKITYLVQSVMVDMMQESTSRSRLKKALQIVQKLEKYAIRKYGLNEILDCFYQTFRIYIELKDTSKATHKLSEIEMLWKQLNNKHKKDDALFEFLLYKYYELTNNHKKISENYHQSKDETLSLRTSYIVANSLSKLGNYNRALVLKNALYNHQSSILRGWRILSPLKDIVRTMINAGNFSDALVRTQTFFEDVKGKPYQIEQYAMFICLKVQCLMLLRRWDEAIHSVETLVERIESGDKVFGYTLVIFSSVCSELDSAKSKKHCNDSLKSFYKEIISTEIVTAQETLPFIAFRILTIIMHSEYFNTCSDITSVKYAFTLLQEFKKYKDKSKLHSNPLIYTAACSTYHAAVSTCFLINFNNSFDETERELFLLDILLMYRNLTELCIDRITFAPIEMQYSNSSTILNVVLGSMQSTIYRKKEEQFYCKECLEMIKKLARLLRKITSSNFAYHHLLVSEDFEIIKHLKYDTLVLMFFHEFDIDKIMQYGEEVQAMFTDTDEKIIKYIRGVNRIHGTFEWLKYYYFNIKASDAPKDIDDFLANFDPSAPIVTIESSVPKNKLRPRKSLRWKAKPRKGTN